MKTFFLCKTQECTSLSLDSRKIYSYLISNHLLFTKKYSKADLIIISTCGIKKENEDRSIREIKYYHKRKSKSAKLIIIGCLPKINPGRLKKIGIFETIPPTDLRRFDKLINAKIKFGTLSELAPNKNFPATHTLYFIHTIHAFIKEFKFFYTFPNKNFYFLKIYFKKIAIKKIKLFIKNHFINLHPSRYGDSYLLEISRGCAGNCSYCAVKFAIGNTQSRPINKIIKEFKLALDKGYKKFYLASRDEGSYGTDINTTFIHLLRAIFKIKRQYYINFCMNPEWFVKYYPNLKSLLQKNHRKIQSIMISAESGSNKTIQSMNRRYHVEDVQRCILDFKKEFPNILIKSHIMIGFPGETEEDFEKTKSLIKNLKFHNIIIHRYSERPNTLACKMPNKIKKEIAFKRISELSKIQNQFGSFMLALD